MKKPISKRDAYIKELRHVADYATELASGNGCEITADGISEAIRFMLDQPGGDAYASVRGELIAKGEYDQAKELKLFHSKTVRAHHELVSQGQPASYWTDADGQPLSTESIQVKKGKIGNKKQKVVTEIDADYKRRCQGLASTANDEADFICSISELDGTAEDAFFKLYEESVGNGYTKHQSFSYAVEKSKEDTRLAGVYDRFKTACYRTFHMAYVRWKNGRP